MESEFLLNLKEISIQVIVISILVFALTMLIKWPIKKATAKLSENKRKAVNTVIVFIPMLLSFVLTFLYYGLFEKIWFDTVIYDTMVSSYLIAVAIYAIYTRIVILIKGMKNTNAIENQIIEPDLSKETITFLKTNIKTISKALKIDQKNLDNTITKIENLLSIRNEITNNTLFQDIALSEKISNQLNELETKKKEISDAITEKKLTIDNYQKTLTKKGE